jgi:hypothetical protein
MAMITTVEEAVRVVEGGSRYSGSSGF